VEEITAGALAWMEKQAKADQPFFLWYNSTAMHFRTHLADKNRGKSGQDDYSDRMVTHDEQIGELRNKLDELGIADNTIVMYSTDNGPQNDTWPDGANTPFRMMKDTNWEGEDRTGPATSPAGVTVCHLSRIFLSDRSIRQSHQNTRQ